MSIPTTTRHLAEYTEREIGHILGAGIETEYRDDIVGHLDRANKIIAGGGGILNYTETGKRRKDDQVFTWAVNTHPLIITLDAPITSGFTVAATKGSANITFSADPNSGVSVAGWHIRVGTTGTVHRILTHSAGTTDAVLDSVFVDTTVTASSAKIFKLIHTVGSDILRPLSPLRIVTGSEPTRRINITGKNELLDQFPLSEVRESTPESAGLLSYGNGSLTLQFSSYPDDLLRLSLDYIPVPATLVVDSQDPTMPTQFRQVLAHLAAYFILLRMGYEQASMELSLARSLYDEMVQFNARMLSGGDQRFGTIQAALPMSERLVSVDWKSVIS